MITNDFELIGQIEIFNRRHTELFNGNCKEDPCQEDVVNLLVEYYQRISPYISANYPSIPEYLQVWAEGLVDEESLKFNIEFATRSREIANLYYALGYLYGVNIQPKEAELFRQRLLEAGYEKDSLPLALREFDPEYIIQLEERRLVSAYELR